MITVLGGARLAAQLLGLRGLGLRGFGGGDLLVARLGGDGAFRGIDDNRLAVLQVVGAGGGHDGHDAAGTGQNGRVRGRAALRGDDGEGLVQVEAGGVGRGQVFRDQNERGVGDRDARRGNAHQVGDDALADVVQIRRTLALIAADGLEHLFHGAEAFQHGALSGLALLDERVDALRERRVGGEHGDGLQDRSSLLGAFVAVRGLFGTAVQIRVDQRQRLGHALDLGFGRDTVGARRIGRFGKRSCHTNDRADRNAASDANTLDNHMFSLCYGLSPRMTGTSHPRTALLTHQLHRR